PEETRGSEVGYTVDEFNQYFDWLLEVSDIQYYAIASWGRDIYKATARAGKHEGELVNKAVYDHINGRVPVIATGAINVFDNALEALENSYMIGISSVFFSDPYFFLMLENGMVYDIGLGFVLDELFDLAIPSRAFIDLIQFMVFGV